MSKRKLLLADDSVTIQKVVNLTFADEGVEVKTVGDGDAAMESIIADRPSIVLADVNMPGLTGYQICERLRSDEATRDLPVILLVGSFEPFDEAEAARVGANAYLTKPFQSIRQLVAQVSDLMEKAATAEAEPEPVSEVEAPQIAEEQTETVHAEPETISVEPQMFDDLGYPTSQPVEQAAPPSDIDNLYDRSLSGGDSDDLSEIGIDDEMIETSYAAGKKEHDDAGHGSADQGDAAEINYDVPTAEASQTDDTEESVKAAAQFPGEQSGFFAQNQNDPSRFESTIAYDNWKPADMRETEDEQSTEEPAAQPESANASAPAVGEDTIRMEGRFDTTGSANFRFDEVNLLDLENAGKNEVEITTPLNAIEQGSNKQVVSISPELIEMIAQRVVEKMSEKY